MLKPEGEEEGEEDNQIPYTRKADNRSITVSVTPDDTGCMYHRRRTPNFLLLFFLYYFFFFFHEEAFGFGFWLLAFGFWLLAYIGRVW
jgi:hypothetical protein